MNPIPYDVIVVGAGLGGMVAAARLVKDGRRVLVLDRNTHVAGTAYVFRRSGFHFPMGPLGFSSPNIVGRTLAELGDTVPLPLKRVHYRLRAFGMDLPLSRPFPEMKAELITRFSRDAEGIVLFFDKMEEISRLFRAPHKEENKSKLTRASAVSAGAFLTPLIQDDRLRRVLGSQGSSEPYAALPLLAAMWNLMNQMGIWYPEGGIRILGDRLRERILDPRRKGEIRLNAEAARILHRQGRIIGVELTTGERIEAPVVISNADFKQTFLRLLEGDILPEGLAENVRQARQTESNLQVSLGLNEKRVDCSAFAQASRLIYKSDGETSPPDWTRPEVPVGVVAGRETELCLLGSDDPSLAPPGRTVLVLRTAADYQHFARYRPAWGKRSPTYRDYKTRLGWGLVREAEKVVPGLSGAIEMMDVATPLTFEERGGRSGGAVAGWSWDFEENRDPAPRELVLTPITGLLMVGYQAFSSLFAGGVPTAMESGMRAAIYALEGRGPATEFNLPG